MLKPDAARTIWLDLVRSTLSGFRGVAAAATQQIGGLANRRGYVV
jgi:hypothetical protein